MSIKKTFVFSGGGIKNHEVWDLLQSTFVELNCLSRNYSIGKKRLKAENVYEYLRNKYKDKNFSLEADGLKLSFQFNLGLNGYVIHVEDENFLPKIDWLKVIQRLGFFVMGRLYDATYDLFQNMEDYETLKVFEGPTDSLVVFSDNGFERIDISVNKGREIWCKGYIEAVASTMWLGDKFFELTGANKEAVKATEWLEVTEHSPGVLKIVAQDKPFTSDRGKEGELQDKLRDLLFPGHV